MTGPNTDNTDSTDTASRPLPSSDVPNADTSTDTTASPDTNTDQLNVEEPLIADPTRSDYLPGGGSLYLRDGQTYRADSTGSVYVADADVYDDVLALANLYPDTF